MHYEHQDKSVLQLRKWGNGIVTEQTVKMLQSIEKEAQQLKVMIAGLEKRLKLLDVFIHQVWYQEYQIGKTISQIADVYGVSSATIHKAFKSHQWGTRKRGGDYRSGKVKHNEGA